MSDKIAGLLSGVLDSWSGVGIIAGIRKVVGVDMEGGRLFYNGDNDHTVQSTITDSA